MRLLLTLTGCLITMLTVAQTAPKSVRIQISYEKAGHHLEQAVETIEAVNTIGAVSTVEYEAGRTVMLLPGFQAQHGSVFTASIKPVATNQEGLVLRLNAFPNPFEQSTTIDYFLPADGKVNVWITDSQGKIIAQLVNDENQSAGKHQLEWKPASVEAGIYIPIVEANQQKAISRLIKK